MFRLSMAVLAVVAVPSLACAEGTVIDGSAAAIREVVSGKTCTGDDVLKFGPSVSGAGGTFERRGRAKATYRIGYGTILIRRDGALHGHLASVSVTGHRLYMSASSYQCER